MSVVIEAPVGVNAPEDRAERMVHIVCECSIDLSLCGRKLFGDFCNAEASECVVCVSLADTVGCPRCGAW